MYLFNTNSPTIFTLDMAYHRLNATDWFYIGFTIGDQRLGTTMDPGILKLNYTI